MDHVLLDFLEDLIAANFAIYKFSHLRNAVYAAMLGSNKIWQGECVMGELEETAKAAETAWRIHVWPHEKRMEELFHDLVRKVDAFYTEHRLYNGRFRWLRHMHHATLTSQQVTTKGLYFDQLEYDLGHDELLRYTDVEKIDALLAEELRNRAADDVQRKTAQREQLLAQAAHIEAELKALG